MLLFVGQEYRFNFQASIASVTGLNKDPNLQNYRPDVIITQIGNEVPTLWNTSLLHSCCTQLIYNQQLAMDEIPGLCHATSHLISAKHFYQGRKRSKNESTSRIIRIFHRGKKGVLYFQASEEV